MSQETKREASARKRPQKLNEAQRAEVAREYRRVLNRIKLELKPALKIITDAVDVKTLKTNEEFAELEAAFDVIRDAAKEVAYKTYKDQAEVLLLQQLYDKDLPKFTVTGAGTVTTSKRKFWSMKDPRVVIQAAKDQDNFDVFTTAISDAECNKYYDETGKPFPGTDYWEKTSLSFTQEKPKKGKK